MQSKAFIVGFGQTRCGYYPGRDMRSLISEAYIKALNYSGVDPGEIQQMWLSHYPPQSDMQMTAGQVVIEAVGLGSRVGCICIEQACASGGQAIHDASLAIESGRYDCILLMGFGKMSDSMKHSGRPNMFEHAEGPFEESGFNPFYWHAGIVLTEPGGGTEYYKEANFTVEDRAAWNQVEWWYASRHPNSLVYGKPVPTLDELIANGGGPHESWGCDGASVIILGSRDFARKYTDKLIYIASVSHKLESSYYAKMLDYGYGGDVPRHLMGKVFYSHSVENAWQECFAQANIKPSDLDLVNVHDCSYRVAFSFLEGLQHPDIPPGTACKWFSKGEAYPDGKLPACTLGSARFGQPRGASGLNYLIENYMQLRGDCGERQVKLKNYIAAGTLSPGRPAVHILRREI